MLTTIRGIYQDGIVKPLEYLDVDDKQDISTKLFNIVYAKYAIKNTNL